MSTEYLLIQGTKNMVSLDEHSCVLDLVVTDMATGEERISINDLTPEQVLLLGKKLIEIAGYFCVELPIADRKNLGLGCTPHLEINEGDAT